MYAPGWMRIARAPIAAGVLAILLFGLGYGIARALGSPPPQAVRATLPSAAPAAEVRVETPSLAGRPVALIRPAVTSHVASTPVSTGTQGASSTSSQTAAAPKSAGSSSAATGGAGPTTTSFSSGGD